MPNAIPPDPLDTAITNAITVPITQVQNLPSKIETIGGVQYTVFPIKFHFLVDWLDAVGMDIYEWGTITQDGRLFSRLTRAVISKTDEMQLLGEWTINI